MGEMWSAPMFKKAAAANRVPRVLWYLRAWLDTSMTRYSIPEARALAKCFCSSKGSGVVRWDSNRSTPSQVSMEEITPQVLPEGARYFAIRYVGEDAMALLLDDIVYIPKSSTLDGIDILGYNVYRDGELLTPYYITEPTFTDTDVNR